MTTAEELLAAFVDGLPESRRAEVRADSELAMALVEGVCAATCRLPGVGLDVAAFARWLGSQIGETATTIRATALSSHVADLYLAWACIEQDEGALAHFDRTMLSKAQRVLMRMGLSAADADEVKQDLRVRLLLPAGDEPPRLASYRGAGPLVAWIGAVAGRRAADYRRRKRPIESLEAFDELEYDPELDWLRNEKRAVLKRALQTAVNDLPSRDRAILRALVVDGRNVGEVADAFGVHRVTASRWLAGLRGRLLQETRICLRECLQLEDHDVDSVLRVVDSHFDASLARVLR